MTRADPFAVDLASAAEAVPDTASLRARALCAVTWRTGAYVIGQLVRIGANVALAHLLFPEAFGLVALAGVFVQGLRMFSELGIGPAIIQNPRDDPAFLNTAWTLQVARGFGLFLGSLAFAWPASWLYDEPRLAGLMVFIGLNAVIGGFNSTNAFTLNRKLAEGRRAVLDLVADSLVGRGVMVAWALLWPSPWALVGGTCAGVLTYMVGSHLWLPGIRNRLHWDRAAARALVTFGRWILVGAIIAFFSQQIDKLLLGRLAAIGVLGVYTISLTVARMPQEFVGVIAGAVLYPALAEVGRLTPERFLEKARAARRLLLLAATPCVLAAAAGAPWFFALLYDARYQDARWMAPLASLTVWFTILSTTAGHALLALGATRPLAFSGLAGFVTTGAACWVGHQAAGLPGFILGTTAGALTVLLVVLAALRHRKVFLIAQDARYTLLLLALLGLVLAGHFAAERLAPRGLAGPLSLVWALCVVAAAGVWSGRRVWAVWGR